VWRQNTGKYYYHFQAITLDFMHSSCLSKISPLSLSFLWGSNISAFTLLTCILTLCCMLNIKFSKWNSVIMLTKKPNILLDWGTWLWLSDGIIFLCLMWVRFICSLHFYCWHFALACPVVSTSHLTCLWWSWPLNPKCCTLMIFL